MSDGLHCLFLESPALCGSLPARVTSGRLTQTKHTMTTAQTEAAINGVNITLTDSSFYKYATHITIRISECCDAFTLKKSWGIFIELRDEKGRDIRPRSWLRQCKLPQCWFNSQAQASQALPNVVSVVKDHLTQNGWVKQD